MWACWEQGWGCWERKWLTSAEQVMYLAYLLIVSSEVAVFRGNNCREDRYPLLLYPLLKVRPHTFSYRPPYYLSSNPDHTSISWKCIDPYFWTSVSIQMDSHNMYSCPLFMGDWFQDPCTYQKPRMLKPLHIWNGTVFSYHLHTSSCTL